MELDTHSGVLRKALKSAQYAKKCHNGRSLTLTLTLTLTLKHYSRFRVKTLNLEY